MVLNKIDFLSPQITLFFYEKRAHTSKMGGFLVLTMLSLSLAYIIYLLYIVIAHKNATSIFYQRFEWEAGYYSLNSSSFFHFIQIFSPENGGYFDEYNPRLIYTYTTFVHSDFKESDLGLYDHWVFDKCRKNIDDKGIDQSLLSNIDNFTNSVCIRYYYNSKIRQYFPLEDKEFIWPNLEHGTARRNNVYLTTIVQKCSNNSVINKIFGVCPSQNEIDKYINKFIALYLYFTDIQIDPLNYRKPIQKYLNSITSGIGNKQTFVENNIHFSPLQIRTKEGDFFSKTSVEKSFYFNMNRKGTASNSEEFFKLVKYYHLMQNSMQIYERRYNNIFDILPQIGGVTQFLFYIFFWINYIYDKFIIAYDTNSLFFNVKEPKKNIKDDIIEKMDKKNNIKYERINNKINNINNINNKIINLNAINNDESIEEIIPKNKYIKKPLSKINNNFNCIFPKKNDFPSLTNINKHYSNSFSVVSPKNNLSIISPKNDNSKYGLILNENSIGKKNINNNTINVGRKESKKNSLFNIFDNKEGIKHLKQYKTMSKFLITKEGVRKLNYQKEICESLIKEDRMKLVKRLSFFLYIKSHLLKKYKGTADFITRFRKNLLSEEHFFKSHIKNTLFFKQYNLSQSQYISFIDCFNNL